MHLCFQENTAYKKKPKGPTGVPLKLPSEEEEEDNDDEDDDDDE